MSWYRFAHNSRIAPHGMLVFAFALLFSVTIGDSVVGRVLAYLTLDQFIRWAPSIDENQIVLIDITEQDYERIFERKRPLAPAKIIELIQAAHTAGAKVIAVDIDTADWPTDWEKEVRLPRDATIVWARGFYQSKENGKLKVKLDRLLAGTETSQRECYGVPFLIQEAGIIRSFYRTPKFEITNEPSFIDQIIHRQDHSSCLTPEDKDGGVDPRIINFTSKIFSESASTLLAESRERGWGARPAYAGKILIVGGSFHAGADLWGTPVGARTGLEINGQALSSALRNNTRTEFSKPYSFFIDFMVGLLLFFVGSKNRIWFCVIFFLVVASGGVLCLYLFRQYYLFVSFVPIWAGAAIHGVLERYRETAPPSVSGDSARKV